MFIMLVAVVVEHCQGDKEFVYDEQPPQLISQPWDSAEEAEDQCQQKQ